MSSKIRAYIISGIILAVSCVILLVFLLLPNKNKSLIEPFNCSANDITLTIGEEKSNFFNVSNNKSEISFEVDNEGIIYIDKEKIVALKAGVVNVTIIAKHDGAETSTSFVVSVLNNKYMIDFNAVSGCEIISNFVYLDSSLATLKIALIGLNGEEITDAALSYQATDGITLVKKFGLCQIQATQNGEIAISYQSYDVETTLKIIVE